jgi:hypothetical protein
MCKSLQVRWTISPLTAPQPWLPCSGCGGLRAFASSDRIRLNANGRKLDAWLIYRCTACDKTWNRPIFERRHVGDIRPDVLEALHANDPAWIRAASFDLDALRRKARRIDEFPDYAVEKQVQSRTPGWQWLVIDMKSVPPASIRLDRLLAAELDLTRDRLNALRDRGLLGTDAGRTGDLRRPVRHGVRVTIDAAGCESCRRNPAWETLASGMACH